MTTLLIDPEVECKVETPAQRTTATLSAAGRAVRGAPSLKDATQAIVPGSAETKSKTQIVPRAPNLALAETRVYQWGSPAGRIGEVAIPLAFACFPLFWTHPLGDGQWLWYAVNIFIAWGILRRPYILHTGRDWAEFVGLMGNRKVHADEMREIVRKVRTGTGALDHLVIKLNPGSVTLDTDLEEIFEALTRMNPAVRVTTKEYDPD